MRTLDTALPHRVKDPPLLFNTLSAGLPPAVRQVALPRQEVLEEEPARRVDAVLAVLEVLEVRGTWQKAQSGHGRRVGPTCRVSVKRC